MGWLMFTRLGKIATSSAVVATIASSAAMTNAAPLLSETSTAYRILEATQKITCAKTPAACASDPEACKARYLNDTLFEDKLPEEMIAKLCDRVTTAYELPGVFWMLDGMYEEIIAGAKVLGYPEPSRPALGSLATSQVNATIVTPDVPAIRIIVVNLGFMTFANTLVKSASETIEFHDEGGVLRIDLDPTVQAAYLKAHPEILERHIQGVLFALGDAAGVPIGDRKTFPIVLAYSEGSELFAVAHEIAHELLKHKTKTSALAAEAGCEVVGLKADADWAQELQADLLALRIISEVARKRMAEGQSNIFVRYALARAPGYYFLLQQIRRDADLALRRKPAVTGPDTEETQALQQILKCLDEPSCEINDTIARVGASLSNRNRHPTAEIRRKLADVMAARMAKTDDPNSAAVLSIADLVDRGTMMMATSARPFYEQANTRRPQSPSCSEAGRS